jgi:hypothetical protein
MLRTVTGALSGFGLALGDIRRHRGVRLCADRARAGDRGFVFSGGSVVRRDASETTRNVAALER